MDLDGRVVVVEVEVDEEEVEEECKGWWLAVLDLNILLKNVCCEPVSIRALDPTPSSIKNTKSPTALGILFPERDKVGLIWAHSHLLDEVGVDLLIDSTIH